MGNEWCVRSRSGDVRRLTFAVAVTALLVLTSGHAALAKPGGAAAVCKRGGWRHQVDVNGRGFKNQGQCVKAAVHGRLGRPLNPQVTGPFTGTTAFEFGVGGCGFVFQVFDGTFTTPSGPGTFHTEGCVDFGDAAFPYTGSFSLTAPAGGTLSGPVSGTIDSANADFDFTLTVATATGSLSGATGTVHLVGRWHFDQPPGDTISGSVTGDLTSASTSP
jgi:hypothetical protein